jgi:hypothetical protein
MASTAPGAVWHPGDSREPSLTAHPSERAGAPGAGRPAASAPARPVAADEAQPLGAGPRGRERPVGQRAGRRVAAPERAVGDDRRVTEVEEPEAGVDERPAERAEAGLPLGDGGPDRTPVGEEVDGRAAAAVGGRADLAVAADRAAGDQPARSARSRRSRRGGTSAARTAGGVKAVVGRNVRPRGRPGSALPRRAPARRTAAPSSTVDPGGRSPRAGAGRRPARAGR